MAWLTADGSGGPVMKRSALPSYISTAATVEPSGAKPPATRILLPTAAAVTSVRLVGAAARLFQLAGAAVGASGAAGPGASLPQPGTRLKKSALGRQTMLRRSSRRCLTDLVRKQD